MPRHLQRIQAPLQHLVCRGGEPWGTTRGAGRHQSVETTRPAGDDLVKHDPLHSWPCSWTSAGPPPLLTSRGVFAHAPIQVVQRQQRVQVVGRHLRKTGGEGERRCLQSDTSTPMRTRNHAAAARRQREGPWRPCSQHATGGTPSLGAACRVAPSPTAQRHCRACSHRAPWSRGPGASLSLLAPQRVADPMQTHVQDACHGVGIKAGLALLIQLLHCLQTGKGGRRGVFPTNASPSADAMPASAAICSRRRRWASPPAKAPSPVATPGTACCHDAPCSSGSSGS